MVRKAKAQLELNLVRDVKGKKNSFCKYISGKRKIRENVVLLLNGAGALLTEDIEKTEILKAFFTSILTSRISLQKSKDAEAREKIWSKKTYCCKRIRSENI